MIASIGKIHITKNKIRTPILNRSDIGKFIRSPHSIEKFRLGLKKLFHKNRCLCLLCVQKHFTGEFEIIDEGVSLALSLWLRSEILLKSDRPKAALEDLKLALKERLPAKMRAQYYWRMGHCYKGIVLGVQW